MIDERIKITNVDLNDDMVMSLDGFVISCSENV